ncbi:MAG: 4Fe-4S binding protein [Coriobacteriaceae bacterium]
MKGCPEACTSTPLCVAQHLRPDGRRLPRPENYNWNTGAGKAGVCIQCGACESVCPQHIEIVSQLERAVKLFE